MGESDSPVVVSDAGPLIHLDEIGCLELLDFPAVLIPTQVWEEVVRHRPGLLQRLPVDSSLHLSKSLLDRVIAEVQASP